MTAKEVLAIVFCYGAGIWFAALALKKRSALNQARHWLSTKGRIIESVEYKDAARKATHFRIRYEFHVGEKIEGATPRLSGDWFWNNKQQTAFVSRFVPGGEVEVFYDPRDPKKNCLDCTDASGITAMWVLAVGGTLLASVLVWLHLK